MKKILVPTDFSSTANTALRYAEALSKHWDAALDAIHVYNFEYLEQNLSDRLRDSLREEKMEAAHRNFNEELKEMGLENSDRIEAVLREGYAGEETVAYALEQEVDLIVMGTRKEHNTLEKIFGSVSTDVVRRAQSPVLVVPEGANFEEIENIGYATDFNLSDAYAFDELKQFAKDFNAKLHLVHVTDEGKEDEMVSELSDKGWFESTEQDVSFTMLRSESVVDGLDGFAKDKNLDIMAMFIPHRSFWERIFHRSFTRRMVFHSDLPLLIFHEQDK